MHRSRCNLLLPDLNLAYHKFHSPGSALLSVQSSVILSAEDNGKIAPFILFDLSGSFDTVDLTTGLGYQNCLHNHKQLFYYSWLTFSYDKLWYFMISGRHIRRKPIYDCRTSYRLSVQSCWQIPLVVVFLITGSRLLARHLISDSLSIKYGTNVAKRHFSLFLISAVFSISFTGTINVKPLGHPTI